MLQNISVALESSVTALVQSALLVVFCVLKVHSASLRKCIILVVEGIYGGFFSLFEKPVLDLKLF